MAILVIGSSNTDLVVNVDSIPKPGQTVLGDSFFVNPGGKGANQAVGAARLGKDVSFCCKTGEDDYGRAAKELFAKEGMDTSFVFSTPDHPSGVALIAVDKNGENSIVVASGANMDLLPEDIDRIGSFSRFDIVLCQLEIPLQTVEYIATKARRDGAKFVLNPAPACKLPDSLLSCVDILTPNETEAEIISGIKVTDTESAAAAARKIMETGVGQVIVTLGSKGALLCSDKEQTLVPAFKVRAVDTTAAGDIFNGALCVALSEGKEMVNAIRFASAASSISVTRKGAQASAPYRNEVDKIK
ncbi:MAG: ribokinase [Bacteroidales bacterium]|nr:ribokinase [Candidatus Cacconaster equifaecalis]